MDDGFHNIMDGSWCGVLKSEGRGVLSQTLSLMGEGLRERA